MDMDLATIAQQSPFVVVSFAFLWVLKMQFDERKSDRKDRKEHSKQMLQVIVDNSTAMNNVASSIDQLTGRVERLEEQH